MRARIGEFQAAGIKGVDLYLSAFGPALEEFSRHWPVRRGTARVIPVAKRKAQSDLLDKPDLYAAAPEDALEAARREVKRWRLEQLTTIARREELDALTEWFVLAWDAFEAPVFPYDEALRLARAVGVDLDAEVVGRLAKKKGSDLVMLDAAARQAAHVLGPARADGRMIDALHQAAARMRTAGQAAAGKELLERAGLLADPRLQKALQAVLEVLPPSRAFTGYDPPGAAQGAAADFEALEGLRRLAFADAVPAPKQLDLLVKDAA